MSTDTGSVVLTFSGSKSAKATAQALYDLVRMRGRFMAADAAIRLSVAELVTFFDGKHSEKDIREAVAENSAVFTLDANDEGQEFVVSTPEGRAWVPDAVDTSHTLKQRLMTPEPKPAARPRPKLQLVRVDPSWQSLTISDTELDLEEEDDFGFGETLETTTPISDEITIEPAATVAEASAEVAPEAEAVVEEPAAEVAPEPEALPVAEAEAEAAATEPAATEPEPVAEPEPAAATEERKTAAPERPEIPVFEEVARGPQSRRSIGERSDFSDVADDALAAALVESLGSDTHFLHFGDRWMTSDRAHRLSRGDLRNLKQYIDEQEQPLTDDTLVQDVLRVRQSNPDYATTVFALNYWLSRERDFEFVGTRDQRFWATSDLPPLGTTLRKPNDIGTDYRFLTESIDTSAIKDRSVTSVDHTVSFYEYNLGLLPYDEEMQKLFPRPVTDDQRNAVFTFEIPQTYTTYLVELRYPTPNRGGFFLGLDDLYFDELVPGAMISINATENDGHYKVEYLTGSEESDRLLELDEKRPRYHFRPWTYTCATDPAWVINEDRFPNLANERPLADKVRRRLDSVLDATFTRIGMDDGSGKLMAAFEDLLTAINIERPVSEDTLRQLLADAPNVTGSDADGYTYAG